jgi:hypothetical protein
MGVGSDQRRRPIGADQRRLVQIGGSCRAHRERVENTRDETGLGASARAALPCTRFGPILAEPAGMISATVAGAVA